jgi:ligand-binding sensor domain-containing protein
MISGPKKQSICMRINISQYAHTSWKTREGFTRGLIESIAQTPDGYLWLGTQLELLRFDGVRAVPWQPPNGQQLPSEVIRQLLVGRDGTLWIGTSNGLASWKDGKLAQHPKIAGITVYHLMEDHEGTIWLAGEVIGQSLSSRGFVQFSGAKCSVGEKRPSRNASGYPTRTGSKTCGWPDRKIYGDGSPAPSNTLIFREM